MGKYLNNRLKFHTASRVGIETNQSLAGALNVDGHIVTAAKVWSAPAEDFPLNNTSYKNSTDVIATTEDLVSVFTNNGVADGTIITKTAHKNASGTADGGYVWQNTNYPAVKLYEKVPMTAVEFSDGTESGGKPQAYEIKDYTEVDGKLVGKRVMDWVPPTAVIDPTTGAPVAGYTGIAEAVSGTTWTILQKSTKASYAWALANGNWEFVYIAGMLTFDPSYTPTSANMGYSGVRYTGFAYKGDYLQTNVDTINEDITDIKGRLGAGIDYEVVETLTD